MITEAFPEDSGLFKCVALNSFGTVSCSAHLQVRDGRSDAGFAHLLAVAAVVLVAASLTL